MLIVPCGNTAIRRQDVEDMACMINDILSLAQTVSSLFSKCFSCCRRPSPQPPLKTKTIVLAQPETNLKPKSVYKKLTVKMVASTQDEESICRTLLGWKTKGSGIAALLYSRILGNARPNAFQIHYTVDEGDVVQSVMSSFRLKEDKSITIDYLVSNPEKPVKGAGARLVSQAIARTSELEGQAPLVEVASIPQADGFYDHLGFIVDPKTGWKTLQGKALSACLTKYGSL